MSKEYFAKEQENIDQFEAEKLPRPISKWENIGCINVLYRHADGTLMLQNIKVEDIEKLPVRSTRTFNDIEGVNKVLDLIKQLTELIIADRMDDYI